MLNEMPVASLSLNELSRRVGLAKSNVLRYFESREAVLLELLDRAAANFLKDFGDADTEDLDVDRPPQLRARSLAHALAASFAAQPLLCELLSAQAGVLEHNVSTEVAIRYKQGARESLTDLASLIKQALPELDTQRAAHAAALITILVGALWTHSHPAPAVTAAYEVDPTLALLQTCFSTSLEDAAGTVLIGALAHADNHR